MPGLEAPGIGLVPCSPLGMGFLAGAIDATASDITVHGHRYADGSRRAIDR